MPNFRVTFSKDDVLVYISHLDLNHAFIRALNRAGVELKYSEGFTPHPKLVFALPLSVGMAGENELLDISVTDETMTGERLAEILRDQMPPHITIKKVEESGKKFREISSARYTIKIAQSGIADELKSFLSGEISVLKKTKSGDKQVKISDGIQKALLFESDGVTIIDALLAASPDEYLNPELIVKAAREKGIIGDSVNCDTVRKEILFG